MYVPFHDLTSFVVLLMATSLLAISLMVYQRPASAFGSTRNLALPNTWKGNPMYNMHPILYGKISRQKTTYYIPRSYSSSSSGNLWGCWSLTFTVPDARQTLTKLSKRWYQVQLRFTRTSVIQWCEWITLKMIILLPSSNILQSQWDMLWAALTFT